MTDVNLLVYHHCVFSVMCLSMDVPSAPSVKVGRRLLRPHHLSLFLLMLKSPDACSVCTTFLSSSGSQLLRQQSPLRWYAPGSLLTKARKSWTGGRSERGVRRSPSFRPGPRHRGSRRYRAWRRTPWESQDATPHLIFLD